MPHAGKTSLLGALGRAAEIQEQLLNGRLTGFSSELPELAKRLYTEGLQPATEEIVSYSVRFDPLHTAGQWFKAAGIDALLIDTSGTAANQLLTRTYPFDGKRHEGVLTNALLYADTIFLVVDASAGAVRLESDFDEFVHFLRLVERSRGRRIDISGLPVFVVLTKCDLLAQPKDDQDTWIDRIEEYKARAASHFKEFLARQDKQPSPFGRIELSVWATSINRPALPGMPAKADEPFGVAELYREGLESAQAFNRRRRRATRKLAGTVAAIFCILVLLSGFAALLIVGFWETKPGRLETGIEKFRLEQQSLTRLAAHRSLQPKLEKLQAFRDDPSFDEVNKDKQEFVLNKLQELEAYHKYDQKLLDLDPRNARSNAELDELEKALKAPPPPEYESEWSQTEAVRRRADWLEDIPTIRENVQRVNAWYQKLIQDGRQVLDDKDAPKRLTRATQVLQEADSRFRESDKDELLPGSRWVTYDTVFRFTPVAETRREWGEIKRRLERIATPRTPGSVGRLP
jgi:hypothetical protein